ncbi:ABC transporter permease [Jeotgalibacillus marinus]|uniref:ABC transporter permease n=1 Tax=Jeotgalibacillus marinus TaxID=86667 RepID=A0ABV3Q4G8_9BACL
MNFIKRALLSVKERKGKSLLQIFIFTVICVLVLSGLAIQSAAEKSSELARESLGADITLQIDRQAMMENIRESGGSPQDMETGVPLSEAEKIASLDYLKGYNFFTSEVALANDFEAISTGDDTEETEGNGNPFSGNDRMVQGDVSLRGVLYSDSSASFMSGDSVLEDGEHITEEDLDENVAMIEKNLAELNNLEVGDTLTLGSAVEENSLEVEIIGIYSTTETLDTGGFGGQNIAADPYNRIYVPYTASSKLSSSEETSEPMLESAIYYIQDPSKIDEFKEEAKAISALNFDGEYLLSADDQAYQQMMGPIENVASFSNNVVYLVAIAGAIILGLIVMMAIRERKYEMGVLLAIGEQKWKLIGQFVAEILIVAILALGIASVSGQMVAGAIGDQLLEQQLTQEQELTTQPESFGGRFSGGRPGSSTNQPVDGVEAIDELEIKITPQDFGLLAVIGMLIALISTLIPSLSVLRLQPKTILTKQE